MKFKKICKVVLFFNLLSYVFDARLEILVLDQLIIPNWYISFIYLLEIVLIFLGEILSWSPMGVKDLGHSFLLNMNNVEGLTLKTLMHMSSYQNKWCTWFMKFFSLPNLQVSAWNKVQLCRAVACVSQLLTKSNKAIKNIRTKISIKFLELICMIFAKIILSARPDHRLQSQESNSFPGSLILSPQGEREGFEKRENRPEFA